MELLVKVQSLQKRVLSQTFVIAEKDRDLEEQQEAYYALKDLMKKLPHHNVKEKLNATQRTLTAKTRKLKALSAMIRTKEMDTKDKECTVQDLKQSLEKTKKELIKIKKDKIKLVDKEKQKEEFIFMTTSHSASGYKMHGSGYKIPC